MQTVRVRPPWGAFLALLPLFAGPILLAEERIRAGWLTIAVGFAWFFIGAGIFGRRVALLRKEQGLTSRDVVEIEYPHWVRKIVRGYVAVLTTVVGLSILGAVVMVVALVATR